MALDTLEISPAADTASPQVAEHSPSQSLFVTSLVLITILGAVLRFHGITAKSFWLDEGFSVEIARLSWPQFWRKLWSREANMGLYYFLLHFWLLMGKSEAFIRGLSVLASVATIPALYALGSRLYGRTTALLAAWLLCLSAFHVRYAQEARGYAFVAFFATLATWLFVRNLQEPATARWRLYALAGAFTVYSHFYGGLVILAHGVSLLFLRRAAIPWRKVAWGFGLFLGLLVPVGLFILRKGTDPIDWLPPLTFSDLIKYGVSFSGNFGGILLVLDTFVIGAAVLNSSNVLGDHDNGYETWRCFLVVLWLFVPVGMLLAASIWHPVIFARFLTPFLPAFMLLVAAGITRFRPAALAWAFGVAISICSLLGILSYYKMDFDVGREDWRSASQYILSHAQAGDSVIFYPGIAEKPFNFYRWQASSPSPWPESVPRCKETNATGKELVVIPGTRLLSAPVPGDRVWFVLLFFTNPSATSKMEGFAVRDWLSTGRHRIEVKNFSPIRIVLFEKNDRASEPIGLHAPGLSTDAISNRGNSTNGTPPPVCENDYPPA